MLLGVEDNVKNKPRTAYKLFSDYFHLISQQACELDIIFCMLTDEKTEA